MVSLWHILSYGKEGVWPDDVKEREFPSTGADPQRITLAGLDPDSTYLYSVQAATAEDAGTASFQRSFTTAGQGKAFSTGSQAVAAVSASLSLPSSSISLSVNSLLSPFFFQLMHHSVLDARVPR